MCDMLVKFLELPIEMQFRLSSVFQHLLLMCWSCACVEGASLVARQDWHIPGGKVTGLEKLFGFVP